MAVVRMEGAQAQVLESLHGGAWQERNTLGGGAVSVAMRHCVSDKSFLGGERRKMN